MNLEILTPEKTLFSGEVDSVTLPGTQGIFMVLTDHAPLISSLREGEIICVQGSKKEAIAVGEGFVEVRSNNITACILPPEKNIEK